jgi:hypothetical protein
MGWFSRKPDYDKTVNTVINLSTQLYEKLASAGAQAPEIRFLLPDSRYRCMLFSLATVHATVARRMHKPDAVLYECAQLMTQYCLQNARDFLGDISSPQNVANCGGEYLQEYLNRWSNYITAGPGTPAGLGIVASMFQHIESARPLNDADVPRVQTLAAWTERIIDSIDSAFVDQTR